MFTFYTVKSNDALGSFLRLLPFLVPMFPKISGERKCNILLGICYKLLCREINFSNFIDCLCKQCIKLRIYSLHSDAFLIEVHPTFICYPLYDIYVRFEQKYRNTNRLDLDVYIRCSEKCLLMQKYSSRQGDKPTMTINTSVQKSYVVWCCFCCNRCSF